jgi:hypothetical protein
MTLARWRSSEPRDELIGLSIVGAQATFAGWGRAEVAWAGR